MQGYEIGENGSDGIPLASEIGRYCDGDMIDVGVGVRIKYISQCPGFSKALTNWVMLGKVRKRLGLGNR